MPSDIEYAQAATMQPIQAIAEKAGILEDELELYGRYKAKDPTTWPCSTASRTSPTAR